MSKILSEAVRCQYAIVEFLAEIHPHLPPYWYILEGDDLGSIAFLFGLSAKDLRTLFVGAGILKSKGEGFETKKDVFH